MKKIVDEIISESTVSEYTKKIYALALMAEKNGRVSHDAVDVILLRAWERFRTQDDANEVRCMRLLRRELMNTAATMDSDCEFYLSVIEYAIAGIVKRFAT